jgi:hypothetical protein
LTPASINQHQSSPHQPAPTKPPTAANQTTQATYESLYSQVTSPYYKPSGPLAVSVAVLPAMLALYRCGAGLGGGFQAVWFALHRFELVKCHHISCLKRCVLEIEISAAGNHPGGNHRSDQPAKAWMSGPQLAASLQGADDALGPLNDATFGLLWSSPKEYAYWKPTRCDITLNAWAAWMVGQLDPPAGDAGYTKRWQQLDDAATKWRAALSAQLAKDAVAARAARPTPGPYGDLETLSWARLVLGSFWKPGGQDSGSQTSDQIVGDLAFSRLTGAWRNLTVGGQARVGLVLVKEKGDQATLAAILKSLQGSIRVGGRTAYISTELGGRGAAALQDQSLALTLFVAAGLTPAANPLVQKLAAFISEGPARSRFGPLYVSLGGFDGALSTRGLSSYDAASQSTRPDVQLNATAVGSGGRVSADCIYMLFVC